MRQRLVLAMAAVFLCGVATPLMPVAAEIDRSSIPTFKPGEAIPGEFIVLLKKDQLRTDTLAMVLAKHGVVSNELFSKIGGFAARMNEMQVMKLRADPDVLLVEPNYRVSAYAFQWPVFPFRRSSSSSSKSSSSSSSSSIASSSSSSSSSSSASMQPVPTGINRINDELSPTANINGQDDRVNVDVAVIDTGSQKNHPDLNVFQQANFVFGESADDLNGHGTHVAGTIGALDNSIGVVGVAPGARIWSVKVLDKNGAGSIATIIKGIDYVTSHASEIDAANMSLGCECQSSSLDEAINRSVDAGVVYAVAAGNSAKNATGFSPANNPNVITVSAIADFNGVGGGGAKATCRTDVDDSFADFSNYGAPVDIAAPGVCIYSTWKGSSYNTISGTSMATPHVAGAAALYIATHAKPQNAGDVQNVKNALIAAGFPQNSGDGFTSDPDSQHEPVLNVTGF